MKTIRYVLLTMTLLMTSMVNAATDPLPSWNDTAAKQKIIQFVEQTTNPDSKQFVPVSERVATFDNDGTLWAEQPAYFQLYFTFARVKELAPQHPEWKTEQPFAALLAGDTKKVMESGVPGLLKLVMATHSGMTNEEFKGLVKAWLAESKHPTTKRNYVDMTYQPMLELLTYFQAHDFKTYIVSAGGVEFMRAWAPAVYNIPAEQIIGSSVEAEYKVVNGEPQVVRVPKVNVINDGPAKPISIAQVIGQRPIAAFGNSDGDREMLEWTMAGSGLRLAGLIHHTDAKREWAYDKNSHIGQLDKALTQAQKNNWLIVDMKNDWNTVFRTQK